MIYLIGSAHSHIVQSKKSLRIIYDRIKPEIIMSETSKQEALVFESNVPRLLEALQINYPDKSKIPEIIELLRERYLGFEYCFNRAYAIERKVQHEPIDKLDGMHALKIRANIDDQIAMLSRREINLVQESLRYKKRKEQPLKQIRDQWKKYEEKEGTEELDKQFQQDEEFKRDIVMEENIRRLNREGKTLVGIVGAVHILESPMKLTLYSRLKDLKPKRIYLFKPITPQLA